ncbi:MAG: radical SAM protein [Candidatus Omnitrophota bacterium]
MENKVADRILLVQSPPWGSYAPPLGIAYLVTFLKSRGFAAEIYDLNMDIFLHSPGEIREKWDTQDFEFWASGKAVDSLQDRMEPLVDKIISFNAGIIGFSATFASVPFLNRLLSILRKKANDHNLVIVIGGGGASYREVRSKFEKNLIDYFVVGEGEGPLLCLLKGMQGGHVVLTDSNCVVWKDSPDDPAVCLKAIRPESIEINEIPFPTFEEFDLKAYTQEDLIPLISSRGCIRRCTFCRDSPLKKPYRVRDPESVAQEMRYHVQRYNRKRFEFCDLLINGDLGFLDKFCTRLIDMDLGVAWGGQATVRKDMGSTLIKKMKKAGCGGLTFGMESFSDHVLKLMAKGSTVKDSKDMLVKVKEAGMRVEINLMVGFPGETEEDVAETIDFIRQNSALIDKINSLNICTLEPGMHLFDHLEEYNIDRSVVRDLYAWFTKDMSNTIQVRTQRHKKMASVFSELNLIPAWQNVRR